MPRATYFGQFQNQCYTTAGTRGRSTLSPSTSVLVYNTDFGTARSTLPWLFSIYFILWKLNLLCYSTLQPTHHLPPQSNSQENSRRTSRMSHWRGKSILKHIMYMCDFVFWVFHSYIGSFKRPRYYFIDTWRPMSLPNHYIGVSLL